jgi:hypothetical protein
MRNWLGAEWSARGAVAVLAVGLMSGCGSDPVWGAPNWDANTAEALGLRDRVASIANEMRAVEQGGAYDEATIRAGWESGAPTVRSITHAGFTPIMNDSLTEFAELAQVGVIEVVDASGAWTPGAAGGVSGSLNRGLNEGGLEIRQVIDKALFGGAALYGYAANLTADGVTAEEVEAIAALWGADATLSAEGTVVDSANYARSMGYFDETAAHLTAAQANPGDANAVRDAFRTWEIALFARFVRYMRVALEYLQDGIDNENVVEASHYLSEGVGLVVGFYGYQGPSAGPLAGAGRVVTDAQIERMMTAMGVDMADLGASTTGALLTDVAAYEAAIPQAEAAVAEAFGLSPAEVEAMRVEATNE